jgi:hypothetical protein
LVGELTDGAGPVGQQFEDGPAGRITEQTQPGISVSDHDRKAKLTIGRTARHWLSVP